MDKQKLIINGGRKIEGELSLHGAKNAALPILAATVLIKDGESVIHNLSLIHISEPTRPY